MSPTSPDSHGKPELPYCRNCHFTLATPRPVFCGHCGQETDLHPPSVREMFTEYLGHYVAFDGPLWRTLWALIFLPGHLTNAYFHGQRRRYVLPLRVYLSASFVFFIGSVLLPQADKGPADESADAEQVAEPGKPVTLTVKRGSTPAETAAAAASAAGATGKKKSDKPQTRLGCHSDHPETCTATERWLTRVARQGESMTLDQWIARIRALAPYALLAMQPVFAALLLLMFAGSGRRYAEHFVFSLHSHSLWFLALLPMLAMGQQGPLLLAVFGHGLLALRRVYDLRWWGAIWRGILLSVGYCVLLLLATIALLAWIAATAPAPVVK